MEIENQEIGRPQQCSRTIWRNNEFLGLVGGQGKCMRSRRDEVRKLIWADAG